MGVMNLPWSPPSLVTSSVLRQREVYSKVGFLSESELVKVCGVSSKALKISPGQIMLEDRNEQLKGFYVSLLDCPEEVRKGIRKIKMTWAIRTEHQGLRLTPERQIRQEQGQLMFNYCVDQQLEKLDSGLKTVNRSKLPTVAELISRAQTLLKAVA